MIQQRHSFSIENKTNPLTKAPFGATYGGIFTMRRPSRHDWNMIDVKKAAAMAAYGPIDPALLAAETRFQLYVFALVSTIACGELPEWFDAQKMYEDDDDAAVQAVAEEATAWLGSFRPQKHPAPGGGSGEQSQVLVSPEV